ncbi:response regulator transcription factor [Pseudoflavitalea sp. X16]|uniref:LytR/AlgR family response regulator transcription factor n=1 Tax=Paraflavitalea devenefica TaxID=2716334 RepID=UPI0014216E27|nr:LytTR family DNA-binding domain-containing protein [Paraflavitalea devenefica]NII28862.1 response regulator transcription factor [Paraflavitalea devenefica]
MPIKTIIIEDEESSLVVLTDFIQRFASDLQVLGTAGHVNEAIELLENNSADLVFMDVRLANGTSFEVLRKLSSRNFTLIMITAYDNYALEAFKYAAIDYLLKPIGIPEFEEAIARARKNLSQKIDTNTIDTLLYNLGQQNKQDKRIGIATINGFEFIDAKDITWCKSEGNYTVFHLTNRSKITSSKSLGFYDEILNASHFCRIHHGTIINLQMVKSYIKGKSGHVVMTDGTRLEISQRRKSDFLDKFHY